MTTNQKFNILEEERKKLLNSAEICFDSVNFWEKKAENLFEKMENFEDECDSLSNKEIENKSLEYSKSLKNLMYRLSLETQHLDKLEKDLITIELKIISLAKKHAKKQKK